MGEEDVRAFYRGRMLTILDLASARLDEKPGDPNVVHDLGEIVRIATEALSEPDDAA